MKFNLISIWSSLYLKIPESMLMGKILNQQVLDYILLSTHVMLMPGGRGQNPEKCDCESSTTAVFKTQIYSRLSAAASDSLQQGAPKAAPCDRETRVLGVNRDGAGQYLMMTGINSASLLGIYSSQVWPFSLAAPHPPTPISSVTGILLKIAQSETQTEERRARL